VINATGVWAAEVDHSIKLRPSRGTHLVFDAASFGTPTAALTIPIPGEINRFVFAMPEQLGRVYLGLTDEESPGPVPDVPEPTAGEVKFLLDTVNTALQTTLTTADVAGAYAGLRPLIDAGEGRTSDLSRDHAVLENDSGMFSIVGGKLTEYRLMAQDVLDRVRADLEVVFEMPVAQALPWFGHWLADLGVQARDLRAQPAGSAQLAQALASERGSNFVAVDA
jgi:glycerol-3-phosphate dehydrogenase